MLGFTDVWIGIIYIATILAAILCVVYGFKNWNKGDQPLTETDKKWALEEKTIEKELE